MAFRLNAPSLHVERVPRFVFGDLEAQKLLHRCDRVSVLAAVYVAIRRSGVGMGQYLGEELFGWPAVARNKKESNLGF